MSFLKNLGTKAASAAKVVGNKSQEVVEVGKLKIQISQEEGDIKKAVVFLLERAKLLVEPSGAVSVAALMTGKIDSRNKNIVAILSGGNLDLDRMVWLVEDCK